METGLRRIPGGTLCIMTKTDGGVGCCGRKSYKVLKNFWLFCYHLVNKWTFCPSDQILFLWFPIFGQWLQRGQWPMPSDIGGFFPSPPPSSPSSSSPSIPSLPWLKAHIQAWRLKSHPAENPPMCCPSYSHHYHHKLQRGNGNRWPSTLMWLFYLLSFFNKNS